MKIPLQKISNKFISSSGINLFVLRLDKIHPYISGNKWFKLKYNLEEAKKQKKDTLLTFGGAYSNHIAATAAAGKEFGFKTIGIIRGDELEAPPKPSPLGREKNTTLKFAEECGMNFIFVSREEYKKIRTNPLNYPTRLPACRQTRPDGQVNKSSSYYLLPEGGTNALAVKGCAEIISHISIPFDFVCCPAGTGGTLAGIISSCSEGVPSGKESQSEGLLAEKAIGFSVLKGAQFLKKDIRKFTGEKKNWEINHDYHFGGYAKHTPELLKFISDFERQNNIPLEHVYTGKMMFGICDLIKKNFFPVNSTVIAIHTGGLQGKLTQP